MWIFIMTGSRYVSNTKSMRANSCSNTEKNGGVFKVSWKIRFSFITWDDILKNESLCLGIAQIPSAVRRSNIVNECREVSEENETERFTIPVIDEVKRRFRKWAYTKI